MPVHELFPSPGGPLEEMGHPVELDPGLTEPAQFGSFAAAGIYVEDISQAPDEIGLFLQAFHAELDSFLEEVLLSQTTAENQGSQSAQPSTHWDDFLAGRTDPDNVAAMSAAHEPSAVFPPCPK